MTVHKGTPVHKCECISDRSPKLPYRTVYGMASFGISTFGWRTQAYLTSISLVAGRPSEPVQERR